MGLSVNVEDGFARAVASAEPVPMPASVGRADVELMEERTNGVYGVSLFR